MCDVPVQDMTSTSQGKHRQTQTGSILPTGLASGTLQVLWNKYSLTPFTAAYSIYQAHWVLQPSVGCHTIRCNSALASTCHKADELGSHLQKHNLRLGSPHLETQSFLNAILTLGAENPTAEPKRWVKVIPQGNPAWEHTPVIPGLDKLKQENQELGASLGYMVGPVLQKTKPHKTLQYKQG